VRRDLLLAVLGKAREKFGFRLHGVFADNEVDRSATSSLAGGERCC
jgi:hypothetical protein